MATYEALREKYRGRQRDALVDTITVGLSCADEMVLDTGLFDGIGESLDWLEGALGALPFAYIIASEGAQVVLGKKAGAAAAKHAAFRAAKSGTAMAVGVGAAMAAGGFAAMPAAVAVHLAFGRFKNKSLLGRRLKGRIETLRFLQKKWLPEAETAETPGSVSAEPLRTRVNA